MELFGKTHIDFIGKRWFSFSLAGAIIVGSLAAIAVKGFNYGIEFTGGMLLQVTFEEPLELAEVRKALAGRGMEPEIQSAVDEPTFIFRQKGAAEGVDQSAGRITDALKASFPGNAFRVDQREFIGPVIGRHLKERTFWAIVLSLAGILVYIAFRFANPIWGLAGLLALFHDVVGVAGMFALTGKEMDLLIVSALLTVAGYSINDTIVIFDRMREMQRTHRKEPLDRLINAAVNDTLSRTIITVLTVQMVCIVLALFGGKVVHNFAVALVVGNFLGSASTILVAAPFVYEVAARRARR